MNRIGKMIVALAMLVLSVVSGAWAQQTKYSTSTSATSPTVTFAPRGGQTEVVALQTSCDVALGAVKFYARGGAGKKVVTLAAAAAVTNIYVENASYGITNGDTVVIVPASGAAPQFLTVGQASTTNFNVGTAITAAQTTSDYVYEVTQQGQVVVADNTAAAGTNKIYSEAGTLFATPGDSPLYVTLSSATNTALQVTVR